MIALLISVVAQQIEHVFVNLRSKFSSPAKDGVSGPIPDEGSISGLSFLPLKKCTHPKLYFLSAPSILIHDGSRQIFLEGTFWLRLTRWELPLSVLI